MSRIMREINNLYKLNDNIYEIIYFDDIKLKLVVNFIGPKDTPYEDIHITVNFIYPSVYPFKPPLIFITPIFHPNITSTGALIISTLTGNDWSPALNLISILWTITSLLHEPLTCEHVLYNDKGKEEIDDMEEIKETCANEEALRLWKEDIVQLREINLTL